MYLEVDNEEFGSFASWSVHAPQTSVFLQHLEEQETEHITVMKMLQDNYH